MMDKRTREFRPMTERQIGVLGFCADFYRRNDQLPPMHVLAAHFGWSSWNSAQEHMEALRRRGLVERNALGKWKFTAAGRALITDECAAVEEIPTDGAN